MNWMYYSHREEDSSPVRGNVFVVFFVFSNTILTSIYGKTQLKAINVLKERILG